jgi:hypothetical protein
MHLVFGNGGGSERNEKLRSVIVILKQEEN